MYKEIIEFIQYLYKDKNPIPLHEPIFYGKEKEYLEKCIDSTFVSSVGEFVNRFEEMTADYTGAAKAVVCVNGTVALEIALKLVGVKENDLVITQPLTFVATANAIKYCNAEPVFVDVDLDTMGLSPQKLESFLSEFSYQENNNCYESRTRRKISACVPMHTFGHACRIDEVLSVCEKYNIECVEDSAESIGTFYKGKHTGRFGKIGILSYNGNKILTTGGGGMIITDDLELGNLAKHLTTTAKIPHKYEYIHDQLGYNFRMPNINAALGVAQMETLNTTLAKKRKLAMIYSEFFKEYPEINFITAPEDSKSNYWLNALKFPNLKSRNEFLEYSNNNNVMTRPVWKLMNKLDMYKYSICGDLANSEDLEKKIVNIPSSINYFIYH